MRVCKITQHLNTQAKEMKVTVAGGRARREGGREGRAWSEKDSHRMEGQSR